jgi:uncharacterized membrane protein YfcA
MESILFILFFLIAYVYSSVGFGGGSSYLAILAMAGLPFIELRLIALICNIIVVLGSTFLYIKHKQISWKKTLPILFFSIPASFLGGSLKLNERTFFILLGISLMLAGTLLWVQDKKKKPVQSTSPNLVREGAIGAGIGLLSGMVGIGGGIFLSPYLHFCNWDNARKIAASCSVFILVNSMAGLAAQGLSQPEDISWPRLMGLAFAVLIGGQLGTRISILKFNFATLQKITAVVVFLAGAQVLLKQV